MNNYYNWVFYNAYRIALGQESVYYEQHRQYCRDKNIPCSEWVRRYNHIKTEH